MIDFTVKRTCPICGTVHMIVVNRDRYLRWRDGSSIQSAFPNLDADKRETLISGTCPDCGDHKWGEGRDEGN